MKNRARLLGTLLLSLNTAMAADRITGAMFATRSEVLAPNAMAATSQPLATQIALDILKQGGSAVDAAIAANAALGLMEPTGCGIGGDLFALVWDPSSRELYGLNASGRSPRGLTLARLREVLAEQGQAKIPPYGPLPVTVPGAVDGWFELHGKFGKLAMSEVLAPAVRYAREGFPVSELIAYYWQLSARRLKEYAGFKATFMKAGEAPREGEIWRNEALARTYEKLAAEGREAFYRGELAQTMASFLEKEGSFLRYEDFASHASEWVEPVGVEYRGYTLWELPPNGQGIAAQQILNILEGYPLRDYGFGSAEHLHLFIEAKKLAFADRAKFYADPAFAQVPVAQLVSKAYAQEQRRRIGERAARVVEAGEIGNGGADTIYLSVADKDGMMVSLIQSNYRGMGSGMCPPGLGFGFQDRGEAFALDAAHANAFAPGKRPFHTIIPAFVTKEGKPWLSFGVMGGATQPQGHAQILMNLIDFGMNLQEAGDAPRVVHDGSSEPTGERMTDGGTVYLEHGFDADVVRELIRRGHRVSATNGLYGGYQAVGYDAEEGVYIGASESRKDGQAAGY